MNRFKKFIMNGLLITVMSLIIRAVSVSFNVYLSNKIGAVAMGVFTLVSTVYGFALTIATSGIGIAATRHIAEAIGESTVSDLSSAQKSPQVRCIIKKCVTYALFFSVSSATVLYLLAPYLGETVLGDVRTVSSLRVLAFSLPPIALSSVFSGYFVAIRRVYKNAVVQVVEQCVKIFSSVKLISLLGANDVESACLSIVIGGTAAEIISFIVQYLLYRIERSLNMPKCTDGKKIMNKVLHTALPVAFSAYVRSGLITLEHMLIPIGLERSGDSKDGALAAYGTVHSMVFPLVLFPSALSSSFAGLLVPEVAESHALGDKRRISRITNRVFNAVAIFSIGTAGIMACFSSELGKTFYPDSDAGKYILMLAPLIPIMYIDTSTDAILKGLGEQVYCMGVNIVDSFLSVILVWTLIPVMGINGYIITVYFTEVVNATLSIARLLTVTKIRPKIYSWIICPIVSITISCISTRFISNKCTGNIIHGYPLFFYIFLATLIYLSVLFVISKIRLKKQ